MTADSTKPSFLERPGPWGLSVALLILMGFFFFMPSAFRAARMGLKNKENDVKDWLPSDFPETAELDWFADHFAGESFVLLTWEGCNVGDQRLRLFEDKLLHESANYREQLAAEEAWGENALSLAEVQARVRARELGEELELLPPGQDLTDWGGEGEKWLASADGTWYYITPEGKLFRWEESLNGPAALIRKVKKSLGSYELQGQFVTAFGDPSTAERINPFYNDPMLLCAPLFQTVQTGATIAEELAAEGGPLWPIDLTDVTKKPIVAKRLAMERLTGTLFAPAVPHEFGWTAESFVEALPEAQRGKLPANALEVAEQTLQTFVAERLDGEREKLPTSLTQTQTDAWYAVYDSLGVEPPPRLTCLLVTLTDLAKDNLAFAVGRGTLGMPQGRLLQLAHQSGIQPPLPPSSAPPPFNREPPESIGGMPPLRMGGPPIDNIAIDEEGTITLVRLVGYCILVGVLLSYFCFRSVKVTIMLFVVGGSAAMLSMSMVGWTGGRVDAILMSMPSLVYVLGLSGSIHVINYYRDEVRFRGRRGAATRALMHAALPCSLAALTTAIGLASLFTSNLKPISNFGLYSAIGVISTLGILFSYLPAALETFSPQFGQDKSEERKRLAAAKRKDGSTGNASAGDSQPSQGAVSGELELAAWWAGVGRWITSHHAVVSVGCIAGLAIASLGLFKITTSVQLLKLFDPQARILRDYAWLEDHFGNLVPMEIVVRMPPEIQRPERLAATSEEEIEDQDRLSDPISLSLLERIEAVARIRKVVTRSLGEEGIAKVGQASSMDTFIAPLPDVSNGWSNTRSQFNSRLNDSRDELLRSDYVKVEKNGPLKDSELWRLSLRVSALSDVDYGLFINELKDAVDPVVQAYRVRAKLLRELQQPDGTQIPKAKVLVLGAQNILDLDSATLVTTDEASGERVVDQQAVFLATLRELLGNERIRQSWIDPEAADAIAKPSDENWDRRIAAADVVIDLAGLRFQSSTATPAAAEKPTPSIAAGAPRLISAMEVISRPIPKHILTLEKVADGLPDRLPVFELDEPATPQVIYTGVVPVVYKAQRTLLGSLVESILLAFVLIGFVMIVLLNPGSFPANWLAPANLRAGFAAGAVSMIPNVFPVLLVFGIMGHLRTAVDIGTMMTASVAMGVAVDDTIHFLTWFRQFLEEGKSRKEAVIETYRRVGPAMTQTTIVGGLGLFIFAMSTFTPTQRFGTLMLVMLAAALIGDLILLPALLAGPLGKVFKPRHDHLGKPAFDPGQSAPGEPVMGDDQVTTQSPPEGIVVTEDTPVLKVHKPPTRAESKHPSPKG
ncbi:integral membrane protein [Rhodopirellula islandica]|uniref:Integral membrane protein n=1 Tax=Rhodopirellula islandica TaxID=595434 RepID=A0A0J1B930_RHOIS|nr:MMPL family transporter [Rhodopirellula islandica]KLU02956.1 integral membrane protein [Rhodopirellula islandica]